MPRKSGPRVVTAGEVVNFFETQPVETAAMVLSIIKDLLTVRAPAPKRLRLRVAKPITLTKGGGQDEAS